MIERPRLLIVDDEVGLTNNLAAYFERSGFHVAIAHNGFSALQKIKQFAPHVVLLDILMPPGIDGREVLRRLRQYDTRTAVIMLTQVTGATERGLTLEEGADDYVNKPFDPFELLARIRAVLRRIGTGQASFSAATKLRCYDLLLDRRAARAYLNGKPLDLPNRTLALLEYLLCHPDELITRQRIISSVWAMDDLVGERMVDHRIWELRRILRDDPENPRYIETVPGRGYRFIGPVEMLP